MTSKEIKSHLKAAKAAIDKQDFQATKQHCQAIFQADERNYTGLVFAGLACLKLGEYSESRQHYKTAVGIQPEGALAWKGFADYYDKNKPVVKDDQLEAIKIYEKLLNFIESDVQKKRATFCKLLALHREFNHEDKVVKYYDGIMSTYDSDNLSEEESANYSETWHECCSYLLGRNEVTDKYWKMLQEGFAMIQESEAKQELRAKLVKKAHARYLVSTEPDPPFGIFIEQECVSLLSTTPLISLPILLHLLLMKALPVTLQDLVEKRVMLSEQQREWIQQLYDCTLAPDTAADGNSSGTTARVQSLGWAGQALVGVADGKWNEAKDAIERSVSSSSVPCECWFFSSLLHLHLRDYQIAEKAAERGLMSLSNSPKFLSLQLEQNLRLCLCQVHMGRGNTKQLSQLLPFLTKVQESCDSHVIKLLVEAHLLLGDIPSAEMVLEKMSKEESDGFLFLGLQGEVSLAQKDYRTAFTKLDEGLKICPSSSWLLFTRAKVIWEDPEQEKSKAYSSLLQAAKADPMNPDVFALLGHYQRQITGDLKRAEKCYQKALTLQPSHHDAAICLGDILWETEDEEKAYAVYRAITADVLPSRVKVAWLRMGLCQKRKSQYNEAIKSFQTILSAFPNDRHCWECLGEAYLARGSYNSALRTFTKCIQLDPDAIHCHYQIATIKQKLGLLKESLVDYTLVLEKDHSFVPALKGKGETYLKLAQSALQQNFDGLAVDYITSALKQLTLAAQLRPEFKCVWKLLGDSCTALNQVASALARPYVPNVLRSDKSESPELEFERVEKQELLMIGCRCYGRALQMEEDAAHLWHDLSLGYFHLAKSLNTEDPKKQETFEISLKASKKAITLKPKNHSYWNTLGVINACKEINDPALAQHSFIRSIQEESNNAMAWANLGVLYLEHDNTELAHEAFKKAQAISPDYVQAWIGQSLIAERVGSEETMDLFRHCTELEYHPVASISYGYWVCHTLGTIAPKGILSPGGVSLNEVAHKAMLQARDNLQKLAIRETGNACALNYLGLLYEHEGLLNEARKTFERALECSREESDSNVAAIKFNLARVQSTLGYTEDAISSLMLICKDNSIISVWLELALALFRGNKLTDSLQAYEQSITIGKRNSDKEFKKSAALTTQAMVAYTQGDIDSCKKLLFQAFQSPPVSLHGLVGLTALACVMNDSTLLLASITELQKVIEWQPDETHLLHPSCSQALRATRFLLTSVPDMSQECMDALDQVIKDIPDCNQPVMPPPSALSLHMLVSDSSSSENALISRAQKLVHSYPNNLWALALLTAQMSHPGLKNYYKSVTQHFVETELAIMSSKKNHSPWYESHEKNVTALNSWLHNL